MDPWAYAVSAFVLAMAAFLIFARREPNEGHWFYLPSDNEPLSVGRFDHEPSAYELLEAKAKAEQKKLNQATSSHKG